MCVYMLTGGVRCSGKNLSLISYENVRCRPGEGP